MKHWIREWKQAWVHFMDAESQPQSQAYWVTKINLYGYFTYKLPYKKSESSALISYKNITSWSNTDYNSSSQYCK